MAMPPGDGICVTMTYFKIYIATEISKVEYLKETKSATMNIFRIFLFFF